MLMLTHAQPPLWAIRKKIAINGQHDLASNIMLLPERIQNKTVKPVRCHNIVYGKDRLPTTS